MGDSSIGQARALCSHLRQELDAYRPHVTLSNMHGLDCIDYMGTRANLLCDCVVRVNMELWLCCTAPTYRGGGVARRSLHTRDDHAHGHCLLDSGVPVMLSALALQARIISHLIWCEALVDHFQLLEKGFPHYKALVINLFKMSCFWFRR